MKQKTILITGTSSGIGKASALHFLKLGHIVHGIDKDPSTLCGWEGYYHYEVNICEKGQLPIITGINHLVFNAGVLQLEEDPLGVNLVGTLNCEDVYVKPNLGTLESIVILGSTAAEDGQDCREYVMSKGGLKSYTLYLANALGPHGVRVNCLTPGAGLTEMNRGHFDEETLHAVAQQNLLKRWGESYEYAEAIYFLCEKATFTTGANLLADGGEMIYSRYVWGLHEERPYPVEEVADEA